MARYEHIQVFQIVYRATIKVYNSVSGFNKEYKYTLGEKMKLICHELIDLIIETNSSVNKNGYFDILRKKLESLRIYYKIAIDLNACDTELFKNLSFDFNEISKQMNNWQNWAKNPKSSSPDPARVPEFKNLGSVQK